MVLCACQEKCWREEGVIDAKSKKIFCRKKKIVPRHEPTMTIEEFRKCFLNLRIADWETQIWRTWTIRDNSKFPNETRARCEPIEDEI